MEKVLSAPVDYFLWRRTLSHPDFPFTSPYQIVWPELSGLIFNFVNDKASDWGIMSRHYYFTNSLPKLLVGTALPLALGGAIWLSSVVGFGGKWARNTGQNVGEVAWTFGPGLVGLVGGMSLIGHKVGDAQFITVLQARADYRQEWRFIVYCVPVLVLIASITAAAL